MTITDFHQSIKNEKVRVPSVRIPLQKFYSIIKYNELLTAPKLGSFISGFPVHWSMDCLTEFQNLKVNDLVSLSGILASDSRIDNPYIRTWSFGVIN